MQKRMDNWENSTKAELQKWIACPQEEFHWIFEEADKLRQELYGDNVHIRGIIEFSNYCKRQCAYCGLNSTNTNAIRYRMEPEDIIHTAEAGWQAGYRTVVLQSGEDPFFTKELLGEIVKSIKKKTGLSITLSCGELPREDYAYFRECGADRYLLKHETADAEIYARLHPCGTLANRLNCLKDLKALGYETGSGFMVGLPGQTPGVLAADILQLAAIPCDMAGIGPFVPHPGTALGNLPPGSTELVKRCVALTRLVVGKIHLPATTALGVLSPNATQEIFSCGANVIMRKLTPSNLRKYYEIYPAEFRDMGDIQSARTELEAFIKGMGRIPL